MPRTYDISDLKREEILERLYKKKFEKNKSKRAEKVIKGKDYKLYVKWKGYDNTFNNLIDNKDIA